MCAVSLNVKSYGSLMDGATCTVIKLWYLTGISEDIPSITLVHQYAVVITMVSYERQIYGRNGHQYLQIVNSFLL